MILCLSTRRCGCRILIASGALRIAYCTSHRAAEACQQAWQIASPLIARLRVRNEALAEERDRLAAEVHDTAEAHADCRAAMLGLGHEYAEVVRIKDHLAGDCVELTDQVDHLTRQVAALQRELQGRLPVGVT